MNKNRGFDNAQSRWPWTNLQKRHSCGVQALHHALLLLGKPSDLGDLLGKSGWLNNVEFGHELPRLSMLARECGTRPENLTTSETRILRGRIDKQLTMGVPVILGSDSEVHWLVIAGFDGEGGYVWIDSARDPLCGSLDWGDVEEWLGLDESRFEAIAIHPGRKSLLARSMVPHIGSIYKLLAMDELLAGEWGLYLDDLNSVFDYGKSSGPVIEAEAFFEKNEEAIVQSLVWMEKHLEEETVREVCANYRTVANFHSFSLPTCFEAHALAQMVLMLRGSTV